MLKWFKADLHVHTCLSPCGDLMMSPQKIVAQVLSNNIDIVAICDHNSAENTHAVIKAAEGKGFVVLPGMEVCTQEEIHILAVFENVKQAFELQSLVYGHLQGENNPDIFGEQIVSNERDEVEKFENKLLLGAVNLSLESIVKRIHELNGLVIAAHIDRESYSVIGQLGFIPDTIKFDALEISENISYDDARKQFEQYSNQTFIRNSDAHFIEHVGKSFSEYFIEEPSFKELEKAMRHENGRMVHI